MTTAARLLARHPQHGGRAAPCAVGGALAGALASALTVAADRGLALCGARVHVHAHRLPDGAAAHGAMAHDAMMRVGMTMHYAIPASASPPAADPGVCPILVVAALVAGVVALLAAAALSIWGARALVAALITPSRTAALPPVAFVFAVAPAPVPEHALARRRSPRAPPLR